MSDPDILVCGYGAMTGAMVDGWLRAGYDPAAITLYNPRPKPAPAGVEFVTELPAAAPRYLLLGFKPAMLGDVAPAIAHLAGPGTIVISVLAGIALSRLGEAFPAASAAVRLMPNLAAALGKSASVLVADGLDAAGRASVTGLAAMLGSAEWLEGEGQFELVTALAGSGPAFVYRFIDALAGGAAGLGLDPETASRLALAMTEGAALLAAASPDSPGALARKVASPGGMTQRGLDVLDEGGALDALVARCLAAARDRGLEMGGKTPPPRA